MHKTTNSALKGLTPPNDVKVSCDCEVVLQSLRTDVAMFGVDMPCWILYSMVPIEHDLGLLVRELPNNYLLIDNDPVNLREVFTEISRWENSTLGECLDLFTRYNDEKQGL